MTSAAGEAFAALHLGKKATMRKTVGESDVYLFAGITGDLGPNHCDEEFMRKTPYGHRIAHGVLAVGFMSTCSTKVIGDLPPAAVVSYGYDGIRSIAATPSPSARISSRSWNDRASARRRPVGGPRAVVHAVPARALGGAVPRRAPQPAQPRPRP